MKKYKNITYSFLLYVVALIWYVAVARPFLYEYPYAMLLTSLLTLFGVLLSFKSIQSKEHTVMGYLSVIIGAIGTLASIGILILELSPI